MAKSKKNTRANSTPSDNGKARLLPLPPLREVSMPAMRTERAPQEISGTADRVEEVLGHLQDVQTDPLLRMCMDLCAEPNPPDWARIIVVGTYDVVSARLWANLREQAAES